MFLKIRKQLSLFYALCFFVVFLMFIAILYFSLVRIMEKQQLDELETYYVKEQHDLFEYLQDRKKKISYEPNQTYFYYIYTAEQKFVHGDESVKGLYHDVEDAFRDEDVAQRLVKQMEVDEEHYLLLSMPIQIGNTFEGYIVLGKSITSQQHFFQKILWLFVGVMCTFTLLLGFVSYWMAGKAMVPIQKSFDKQKKFVSDASHELRTPLSVFYSSLDILEADEKDRLSEFGQELITDLKSEAELMKDLLEKLLFLARHDQKRVEIKKERIALSDLLSNIGTKFERTLPKTMVFQLEVEKNVELIGDANAINELIYILLENASQYTQQGSIQLKLQTTNNAVRITVSDTGIGIAKQDLPFIFDRFYRSDLARKRDGTGLGLSIAQAIVEEHNGTIHVTSEVGKGTTFRIEFPIARK